MIISVSPEELPRRISNQILEITRKNLEIFIKETNHLKRQKVLKIRKSSFFFLIVFRIRCKKVFKVSSNFRVSIPFGFKPAPKRFLYIQCKKKKKISDKKQVKYFAKSKNIKSRISDFSFIHTLFFFFLENFSLRSFSPYIINWQGKIKDKKEWKKIEKPIVVRLIKSLSCLYLKRVNFSSFGLDYKRPDCLKQVTNSIIQGIGGIYENVFKKKLEIERIIFKSHNSLQFSYFFPFL